MSDIKAQHLQASERLKNLSQQILIYSQKYESICDERAIFAFMYFKMTEYLANDLETKIRFDDPTWVAELTEAFGALFMKAMDDIDQWLKNIMDNEDTHPNTIYETVSKPWADVYLAIRNGQSYVLEDMVFSIMAHISYHLPLALLEVNFDADGGSHIGDYHRINDVLASDINKIQDSVAQRYNHHLFFLDGFVGNYDEFLTNYGIRLTRSTAWYNASRLSNPKSHKYARKSIERSSTAFISSIRSPESYWLRLLIMVLRRLIPARRKWPKSSISSSVISEENSEKSSSSGDQKTQTSQLKNEELQGTESSEEADNTSQENQPAPEAKGLQYERAHPQGMIKGRKGNDNDNGHLFRPLADSPTRPLPVPVERKGIGSEKKKSEKEGTDQQYLLGLAFLSLLTIGIIIFQSIYSLMHGINPLLVYGGIQIPNEFDFIGGSPTSYAIGQEILFWTITGVTIKMAYITALETMHKRFEFLKALILWISTSLLAWGIGIGLIFSLSLVSITIGDNTIDPVSSIETVIAFSFIIGFYYEEALRLLGKVRGELSLKIGDKK